MARAFPKIFGPRQPYSQGCIERAQSRMRSGCPPFKKLVNEYYFSQCWDPQGWFWKPAEAAQQQIIELEAQSGTKMRIHLKSSETPDLGAISSAFLRARA